MEQLERPSNAFGLHHNNHLRVQFVASQGVPLFAANLANVFVLHLAILGRLEQNKIDPGYLVGGVCNFIEQCRSSWVFECRPPTRIHKGDAQAG